MGIVGSLKRGFGFLSEAIDEGMDFGKKHLKAVIGYQLVSMIVALAAMVVVGVGVFLSMLFLIQYSEIAAYIVTAALVIAGVLVAGTYSMAANLGAIEFIYNGGKKIGYFEPDNVSVAFKWVMFWIGLFILLLAIVAAIVLLVPMEASGAWILVMILVYLVILLVVFIAVLLLYYVNIELAVKKLGPIDAMKSAFNVLKKNFWETLVFAILVAIGAAVVQVPLNLIVSLITNVFILAIPGKGSVVLIGVSILFVALGTLLRIAIALVVESASLILKVKFYQKITKPKTKKAA
jgi:hypothetical protein